MNELKTLKDTDYEHLLDLPSQADANEGIRQGLGDLANGQLRSTNSSPSSKPSMEYLVSLTARARRDLAQIYEYINAADSHSAQKPYRGSATRS